MKMMKQVFGVLGFLAYASSSLAIDNAHFFKAARFPGIKSNDTENWRSNFDASVAYGDAQSGFDGHSKKTNVLNIYGNQNLAAIFQGVANVASTPVPAASLTLSNFTTLANAFKSSPTFGRIEFKGDFSTWEVNLDARQNFIKGFFLEAHLPIRHVDIDVTSTLQDNSPVQGNGGNNQGLLNWVRLKNHINDFLTTFTYSNFDRGYDETDLGDLTVLAGWQFNTDRHFRGVHHVAGSVRAGILFPTGRRDDLNRVFSVPTGYNGHWGVPVRADMEVGLFDWLTFGGHAGVTAFIEQSYHRRVKTDINQNGPIKMATALVSVNPGDVWDVGAYAKLDHVYQGLSIQAGYSYHERGGYKFTPRNADYTSAFSVVTKELLDIVNSDEMIKSWNQHVAHFMAEYDFGVHMKDKKYMPRVSVYYDLPFEGRRSFLTDMIGGGAGISFNLNY